MIKHTFRYITLICILCTHATAFAQTSAGTSLADKTLGKSFRLLPVPEKIAAASSAPTGASSLTQIYYDGVEEIAVITSLFPGMKKAAAPAKGTVTFKLIPASSGSKESYQLEVRNGQAVVTAGAQAGLYYGAQTLSQLMQDARDQKTNIAPCTITDAPDIDYRAIHLDLKHHLDSVSYYYKLMDRLAASKINAVIVEFEDKLAYKGAPRVGASHSISIEEFTKISDYAKERNIEISPLIQGLGHASFILKHPEYQELRDDTASDWSFDPLNPKTYEVQFSLYKDAMDATPHGRYLHVGGDEVGKLGMSELAKKSGMKPFELQMHWLTKVCEFAEQHNRIPVFWDDMLFKLSNLYETTYDPSLPEDEVNKRWKENEKILNDNLHLFPKSCVYMRWNYDNPNLPGNLRAIEWYKKNGLHVMAATAGQQIWPMIPKANSNFQAVKDFARLTANEKLDGILLTLWDDASPHFETYWRGIHNFALFTWNFRDTEKEEVHAQFRHRFYGPALSDPYYAFQDTLEQALLFWEKALISKGHRENYPKRIDTLALPDAASPGAWSKDNAERLINARREVTRYQRTKTTLAKAMSVAKRNRHAREYFNHLNERQIYPANLLLKLEKYDRSASAQQRKNAAKEVLAYVDQFPSIRKKFEDVFTRTRVLENPSDYLMDQNHHAHLANGTRTSDWMYVYELAINEKIKNQLTE